MGPTPMKMCAWRASAGAAGVVTLISPLGCTRALRPASLAVWPKLKVIAGVAPAANGRLARSHRRMPPDAGPATGQTSVTQGRGGSAPRAAMRRRRKSAKPTCFLL